MSERIDIIVSERGSRVVQRSLLDIGGGATKAESAVQLLRRALGTLAAGFTLASVVSTLAEFSQAMSTVQAITRATGDEFTALREEAKRLGAETRFSATQAAEGAIFLARAGFDTNQVLASLEDTLFLAQAGALGLGEAADIASNIMQGFRMSAEEAGRAVDVIAYTANNANTDVMQLGDAMKYVAPVASGMGVSLEETAAAAAALSDAGLQASMAGTGLRRILSELEAPSAKTRKILTALGVSTEEVRITQVGLTAALERLRKAGVDTGTALEIFGDRGGPAFEVLANSIPKVKELTSELDNVDGFARQVANTMDDNLNGALLATKSAAESLVIAFGDLGAESLLTQSFRNLATAIRFVANNLEETLQAATVLGAGWAFIYRTQIIASIKAATVAMKAFTVVIASNPVGLFLVALSTLVAYLTMFRNEIKLSSDGLATLNDLWVELANAFMTGMSQVTGWFSTNFGLISSMAERTFGDLEFSLLGYLRLNASILDTFIGLWLGAYKAIEAPFKRMPTVLQQFFLDAMNGVLKIVQGTVNMINRAVNVLLRAADLEELPTVVFDRLVAQGGEAAGSLGEAVQKGFLEGFNANYVGKALDDVVARAEANAAMRALDGQGGTADDPLTPRVDPLAPSTPLDLEGLGTKKTFEDYRRELEQEVTLLGMGNTEREKAAALYAMENELKRQLTDTERALAGSLLDQIQALTAQNDMLLEIKGPMEEVQVRQAALNQLYADGKITTDEYTQKLNELAVDGLGPLAALYREIKGPAEELAVKQRQINELFNQGKISAQEYAEALRGVKLQQLDAEKGMGAGFERGLMRLQDSMHNVAATAEQTLVGAFNKASDALADFVTTGKMDFEGLVDSIAKDITRLAMQQMMSSAFGGGMGGDMGGGGFMGALFSGLGNLFGFATGGSFEVGGQGGTDSQLVAFKASPNERVTVETPEQQRSRQDSDFQGRPTQVIFNIQTNDAESFRRSEGQIMARAGAALERANKRNG